MTEAEDDMVARPTASYPPAQMTPAEFEVFVVDLIRAANPDVSDLDIRLHDKITGEDGTYDFDATIRFNFGGMAFLVLVEAKHHANPIKRELVQVLHQKTQSVGGNKGVMIATAPYQQGALAFAKAHGIALVTVTEGRFLFAVRTKVQPPVMSRQQADLLGIVPFAGYVLGAGEEEGSTRTTLVATDHPDHIAELILGCPPRD